MYRLIEPLLNQSLRATVVLGMAYRRTTTLFVVLCAASCAATLAAPGAAYAADRTAPTIPQNLRVTATSADSASLAWSPSTDSSGSVTYRIYVGGAWRGSATTAAYTLTGLASDTEFTVAVRAQDRYGNLSALSNSVIAKTTSGAAPPGPPSNLQVTAAGYDYVSLAWEPGTGAIAYYQILRNGLWVNSSYGTTGTVRNLAAGTTYTLEVRARDGQGNVSAKVAVIATTRADLGPPTVPENLRVVTDGIGVPVGLAWDASADDRGVVAYWLLADGATVYGGGQGVDFFTLVYIDCTVFSGETHTFTVRAMDLSGNLSAASTPVTVTVP